MIRLQHVSMVFGSGPSRVAALNDVSFHVAKGEFVVLSGASGAGKTTLLRLLYAAEIPSEGDIDVAGFDVAALRRSEIPRLRRSIGIVFQDSKLLAGRTVFENVAFVLRVLGTARRDITPKAFAALKAVGLSSRAQAFPHQLSQGEAQRASLARAIVKSPGLLLADEPTGNLDDEMANEILALVKDIWSRGTTVVFATHQARLVPQLKRRTLKLEGGRLVKDEG
jgi:cell division transport system ATP-binding protein